MGTVLPPVSEMAFDPSPVRVRALPLGWFVRQSTRGKLPRLVLVYAGVVTTAAIALAVAWRLAAGPRGAFEQVVPMLGASLRWAVGLPLALVALKSIPEDEIAGRLSLARRAGVSRARWLRSRALGATIVVALAVFVPLTVATLVLSGMGGGWEGALARASLVFPGLVLSLVTGGVLGGMAVLVGSRFTRRPAIALFVVGTIVGELAARALGPHGGPLVRDLVSPMAMLDDLSAGLFAMPDGLLRGTCAVCAMILVGCFGAGLARS